MAEQPLRIVGTEAHDGGAVKRWPVYLLVLAALALLVIVPRALGWRSDRDRWEARADSAVTRATRAEAWVDTLDARIDSLTQAVGDSVVVLVKRDTVIRVRVDSVRALPVPDTCAPFVAVRDSLLDEALASAESWKRAYGQQVLIAGLLKASRDTLRVSLDSALAVLRERPKPPSLLGLGATCGLGLRGYDCAVGVTVRVDPVGLIRRILWMSILDEAGRADVSAVSSDDRHREPVLERCVITASDDC